MYDSVISGIVCVWCVCVICALKGKWLELSTPNLLHMYSIAVARHALTRRSKGQGHTVTKDVTVAWLLVAAVAVVLLLLVRVCIGLSKV